MSAKGGQDSTRRSRQRKNPGSTCPPKKRMASLDGIETGGRSIYPIALSARVCRPRATVPLYMTFAGEPRELGRDSAAGQPVNCHPRGRSAANVASSEGPPTRPDKDGDFFYPGALRLDDAHPGPPPGSVGPSTTRPRSLPPPGDPPRGIRVRGNSPNSPCYTRDSG